MDKDSRFVGLDVHADTIAVAVAEPSGEVDFLLWRDERCVAIEAKATHRFRSEHTKGLQAFAASYRGKEAPRKILVYLGDQRLRMPEGIDVLPIGDFLQQVENDQLFG